MTFTQHGMPWVLGEDTELVVERLYVMISPGIPNLKRVSIRATDTEARKRGESRELDTPVAHAANDADSPLDISVVSRPPSNEGRMPFLERMRRCGTLCAEEKANA
jgi:hypothetical protein